MYNLTRLCFGRMKIVTESSKTSKPHETGFYSSDNSSSHSIPSALFNIFPLCSFCKYLDIAFRVPEQFGLCAIHSTSPLRACGLTKLVTILLILLEFSLFPDSEYAHRCFLPVFSFVLLAVNEACQLNLY